MNAPAELAKASLEDKYTLESGRVFLTGMQALIRLMMLQRVRDQRAGLNTAGFVSGYRGSPLGGFDQALWRAKQHLERSHIRFQPGLNEDLAATSIWGSQQLNLFPGAKYDGVFSMWYGKGPGVDRCGDVFKHGNAAGSSPHGGVLLLAGDDHTCKSSTLAHQSEYAFMDALIPVLNPSNVQDILDLGLYGWALSRFSGCWVAMKLVGQLADGGATVTVSPDEPGIVVPELWLADRPFRKATDFTFFPGLNIETERRLSYERHRAVLTYARANSLTWAEVGGPGDRVGLVTAGKSHADLRQALLDLGLDDGALRRLGVRVAGPLRKRHAMRYHSTTYIEF